MHQATSWVSCMHWTAKSPACACSRALPPSRRAPEHLRCHPHAPEHPPCTTQRPGPPPDQPRTSDPASPPASRRRAVALLSLLPQLLHPVPAALSSPANPPAPNDILPAPPAAAAAELHLPLERDDGVFCLTYRIDGRAFRGVLDTGSPFLTISGYGGDGGGGGGGCAYWGCWRGEGRATELDDTLEMFASQDGVVQWRRGEVRLAAGRGPPTAADGLVFGVFRSLLPKGGTSDQSLVGLVKYTAPGIRPSMLSQTGFRSFSIDFAAARLTLSAASLLPSTADAVSLLDLRPAGAPSRQYVVLLSAVYINDQRLLLDRPMYGMLDSGSTGLYMSERLYTPLQQAVRGWRSCDVEFKTQRGETVRLSASRPSPQFLCFPTDFPWLAEEQGFMLVLGTVFLENMLVTIDMDSSLLLLQRQPTPA